MCVWVRLNTDRSLDAYRCHPVFVGRFAAGSATAAANCQCGSAAFQTWLTRRLAASQSYYPLKVIWFSRVSSSSASVTFLLFYFDRMTCALCDIHFWSICWAICRGFCKSIWLDAGGRDRRTDRQTERQPVSELRHWSLDGEGQMEAFAIESNLLAAAIKGLSAANLDLMADPRSWLT